MNCVKEKQSNNVNNIFNCQNTDTQQIFRKIERYIRSSIKYNNSIKYIIEKTLEHSLFMGFVLLEKYHEYIQEYKEMKELAFDWLQQTESVFLAKSFTDEGIDEFSDILSTFLLLEDYKRITAMLLHYQKNHDCRRYKFSYNMRELTAKVGALLKLTDNSGLLMVNFWRCSCCLNSFTIPAQMVYAYKKTNGVTTTTQERCYDVVINFLEYLLEQRAFEFVYNLLSLYTDLGINDVCGGGFVQFLNKVHFTHPRDYFRGFLSLELLIKRKYGDSIQAQQIFQKVIREATPDNTDSSNNEMWNKYYTYFNWYSLFKCIELDFDHAESYILRKENNSFFDASFIDYNSIHLDKKLGIQDYRTVEINKYRDMFQKTIEKLVLNNTFCAFKLIDFVPERWNVFVCDTHDDSYPRFEANRDTFNFMFALQKMSEELTDEQMVRLYFCSHLKSAIYFERFFQTIIMKSIGDKFQIGKYVTQLFNEYTFCGLLKTNGKCQIQNVKVNFNNLVEIENVPDIIKEEEVTLKVYGFQFDTSHPRFKILRKNDCSTDNLQKKITNNKARLENKAEQLEKLYNLFDDIICTGNFKWRESGSFQPLKFPLVISEEEKVIIGSKICACCHKLVETGKAVQFVQELQKQYGYPFANLGEIYPQIDAVGVLQDSRYIKQYSTIPEKVFQEMKCQWDDIIQSDIALSDLLFIYFNTPFKFIYLLSYTVEKKNKNGNCIKLDSIRNLFLKAKIIGVEKKLNSKNNYITFTPLNVRVKTKKQIDTFGKYLEDDELGKINDKKNVYISLLEYDAKNEVFTVDRLINDPPKKIFAEEVFDLRTKKEARLDQCFNIYINPNSWTKDEIDIIAPTIIDGLLSRANDGKKMHGYLEIIGHGNPWRFSDVLPCYYARNREIFKKAKTLFLEIVRDLNVEEAIYIYMNSPLRALF